MSKTHIIIGTSAAGLGVLNKLKQLDPESTIICISDEQEIPYNKCLLADYLAGTKLVQSIVTKTPEACRAQNITLLLGIRVIEINSVAQYIICSDGKKFSYDTLFLGLGAQPIIPPISGIQGTKGIFTFYSLADTNAIVRFIHEQKVQKALIIGAGLSGLECADALKKHALDVAIVDRAHHVISSLIDNQAALLIQRNMQHEHVTFYNDEVVDEVFSHEGRVSGVRFNSGKIIATDMIIVAVGMRPRIELLKGTPIQVEQGSMVTNQFMQTTVANIYTGGDVALVKDKLHGTLVRSCTWPDAMLQGLYSAHAMAGINKPYPGIAPITSSAFFGVKFFVAGPITKPPAHYEVVTFNHDDYYETVLLDQGTLKGFLVVGNNQHYTELKRAFLTQEQFNYQRLRASP